ncbi:MAG: hypothetical protein FWD12_10785 [Alphaproteobacteria bacterium]|nr:hypothetical protein [Alphaproteobacteria bacterium]
MRVLVLLPTTGALNRVMRIEARPDLPASGVYARNDFRPLAITADYDALTSKAGPLAALAPPVEAGAHRLWLAGPIEAGKSWELPVLLAHLVVALGAELAAEPAAADIVLWSTGAVDLDLHIVEHDYRLRAKADRSKAALKEAVAAGAQVIALVPAGEDASVLRNLLIEAGAPGSRVETVDGVGAARIILEQALGRSPSGKGGQECATVRRGRRRKMPALATAVGAIALGALTVRDVIPWTWVWDILVTQAVPRGKDELQPHPRQTNDGVKPGDHALAGTVSAPRADPPAPGHEADRPATAASAPPPAQDGSSAPPAQDPAPATAVPVPLHLVEIRDPYGRICLPVLRENVPPRMVDVAMDGPDRFHDSTGFNLCGLEWTLTPDAARAGIQGFDIDLAADRYDAQVTRIGAGGTFTKIRIEFYRDFSKTITYKVSLQSGAAPPGKVQQFQHTVK